MSHAKRDELKACFMVNAAQGRLADKDALAKV
jgi:hypothetical protein